MLITICSVKEKVFLTITGFSVYFGWAHSILHHPISNFKRFGFKLSMV